MLFIAALISLFYTVWGLLVDYPRPEEGLLENQAIADVLGFDTSTEKIYIAWRGVPHFHFPL